MVEDALLRKILVGDLYYAKLWLIFVALRGVSWDKMPFDQRELAFRCKEAALRCLSTFLTSPAYRAALQYAVHDHLAPAAFFGLFLLKVANLFPGEVGVPALLGQADCWAKLRLSGACVEPRVGYLLADGWLGWQVRADAAPHARDRAAQARPWPGEHYAYAYACNAVARHFSACAHGRLDDPRRWHGGSKLFRSGRAGCDTGGFWICLTCCVEPEFGYKRR